MTSTRQKWLMITIALVLILCPNSSIGAQWRKSSGWNLIGFDKNTIPPQILGWYDPDILSGKRPTFYYLKNEDIWNLPPKSDIDIIILDNLRIDSLTPIHIQKLLDWIYNGTDVAITWGWVSQKLETLFGFKTKEHKNSKKFYLNKKCVINIDIKEEEFELHYTRIMTNLPSKTLVIIGTDKYLNEAAMGIIYYGNGRILFDLINTWGNMNYTRSRFQLNLFQWLIGKDVPIVTLKDIQEGRVFARINLRGRIISGWLSNPTDTHVALENSETRMVIPWRGIRWIEIKDDYFKTKIPDFVSSYPKRD